VFRKHVLTEARVGRVSKPERSLASMLYYVLTGWVWSTRRDHFMVGDLLRSIER
jgi:hypothetical protein